MSVPCPLGACSEIGRGAPLASTWGLALAPAISAALKMPAAKPSSPGGAGASAAAVSSCLCFPVVVVGSLPLSLLGLVVVVPGAPVVVGAGAPVVVVGRVVVVGPGAALTVEPGWVVEVVAGGTV